MFTSSESVVLLNIEIHAQEGNRISAEQIRQRIVKYLLDNIKGEGELSINGARMKLARNIKVRVFFSDSTEIVLAHGYNDKNVPVASPFAVQNSDIVVRVLSTPHKNIMALLDALKRVCVKDIQHVIMNVCFDNDKGLFE